MYVSPYLIFEGRCEEAIEFYKRAMGAEVTMLARFKEMPPEARREGCLTPGSENKIMHSEMRIGDTRVCASDGRCTGQAKFDGMWLSLTPANDAQAQKLFTALSEGGKVCMPLGKTFYASSFGMVSDKFGVPWMIIVPVMS